MMTFVKRNLNYGTGYSKQESRAPFSPPAIAAIVMFREFQSRPSPTKHQGNARSTHDGGGGGGGGGGGALRSPRISKEIVAIPSRYLKPCTTSSGIGNLGAFLEERWAF